MWWPWASWCHWSEDKRRRQIWVAALGALQGLPVPQCGRTRHMPRQTCSQQSQHQQANAVWKRKGCQGLGIPSTKPLQLPPCHLLWVKAGSCKNILRTCCSCRVLSLRSSIWLDSEEIADSLFSARGLKWKATARTAASFSLPDPAGGDQSELLPLWYSPAQRAALTHAINS